MPDTQQPLHDRTILDWIRTICANGESGRLEIIAGVVQGELSFSNGKLVDARVGHLTGFHAINAAAAMQNARVSFDPTFAPLASGSITASERVVLKQFFGIDTAAAYAEPAILSSPVEAAPPPLPEPVPDAAEEVTIVRSNSVPSALPQAPLPHAPRSSFPMTLAFAALVIALTGGVVFLMNRFLEDSSPAVVAGVESSSRPVAAPAEQPKPSVVQSTPVQATPAQSAPVQSAAAQSASARPASVLPPVKENSQPHKTAQDLSGKWNVVNVIETTSYSSFKNMKIGFALAINQTGTTFTGSGHKVSENGRSLPVGSRTPIQVKGSIKGDTVEATFFEQGAERKSNGRFVWRVDKAGRGLAGKFATSAARSICKSADTREL